MSVNLDAGLSQAVCAECHTCGSPKQDKPCLKSCPGLFSARNTSQHDLEEAPATLSIDSLASEYGPVQFAHKRHAGMSEMGASCATCHHYSPPGKIEPCSSCHNVQANPTELRQPGLKGAYHRQCLQCHREWSHETDCNVCHRRKDDGVAPAKAIVDATDVMGRPHPLQHTPEKQVYTTPYAQGPIVTFYHKQHVDLFGLKCVSCHKEESCGTCHDLRKQQDASNKKTMEQVHAVCSKCHKADACSKCHDTKERPGFSHASTGWPLNRFHTSLDCHSCHPTGKPIARLNHECTNCHAAWKTGNFRHAVTGLQLSKRHAKTDCEECHAGRKFDKPPACAGCHDDGRDWRKDPPGVRLPSKP
jgi:hypothetical protein